MTASRTRARSDPSCVPRSDLPASRAACIPRATLTRPTGSLRLVRKPRPGVQRDVQNSTRVPRPAPQARVGPRSGLCGPCVQPHASRETLTVSRAFRYPPASNATCISRSALIRPAGVVPRKPEPRPSAQRVGHNSTRATRPAPQSRVGPRSGRCGQCALPHASREPRTVSHTFRSPGIQHDVHSAAHAYSSSWRRPTQPRTAAKPPSRRA